ncbi:MAG: subtilisin family serine protease [Candidatus Latescibacterota bacterium]|jgi:subtilisin family serine protease
MNKFLFFCFITVSLNGIAQETELFFFQANVNDIASLDITENMDGTISVQSNKSKLENDIYGNHTIYTFESAYPNSKRTSLKDVYNITTNEVRLISDLKHNFPDKYTLIDQYYPESDPYYPNDYGATSPVENLGTHYGLYDLDLINAPEAWGITKGSPKVIVGISDSRVDSTNADLKGRVSNYLQYFNASKGLGCSHGSNIAGIAVAHMDNGYGRPGLCSKCDVITNGYGSFLKIEELVAAGAKVINASWVSCSIGPLHKNIEERINEFYEDGIIIVAAAGNWQRCGDKDAKNPPDDYGYPASYEKVMSVTGVFTQFDNPEDNIIEDKGKRGTSNLKDRHNKIYHFGKSGRLNPPYHRFSMQYNYAVDISAPAVSYMLGSDICNRPKDYGGATSAAAPYVTGVIGLMWSINYCLSSYEIESILKLSAAPIDHLSGNEKFSGKLGAGRVDAYAAVKMSQDAKDPKGEVVIQEREFSRFHFRLKNAANTIRIANQTFKDSATVDFTARKGIVLKPNTILKPDRSGYIKLSVNPDISIAPCEQKPPKAYDMITPSQKSKKLQTEADKAYFVVGINAETKRLVIQTTNDFQENKAAKTLNILVHSKRKQWFLDENVPLNERIEIQLPEEMQGFVTVRILYNNKVQYENLNIKE